MKSLIKLRAPAILAVIFFAVAAKATNEINVPVTAKQREQIYQRVLRDQGIDAESVTRVSYSHSLMLAFEPLIRVAEYFLAPNGEFQSTMERISFTVNGQVVTCDKALMNRVDLNSRFLVQIGDCDDGYQKLSGAQKLKNGVTMSGPIIDMLVYKEIPDDYLVPQN